MAKILVVEDDKDLAGTVRDCLTEDHHHVEMVHSGGDAVSLIEGFDCDLLILDWELPEFSGVEICKRYRRKRGQAPVLILTGRSQISDKEVGFDAGADDYMTKPFDYRELKMRVKALLRRSSGTVDNILRVANVSINLDTFVVSVSEKNVHLLPKEFAVLEFLARHPNQVFSAETLLERIWASDTESSANTVRTTLYTLRKKICPKGTPQVLDTVHGIGYKLTTAPD